MKPNLYKQLRLVIILVAGIGILTTIAALSVAYWSEVLQREFLDSLAEDEFNELLEHLEDHPDAPLPKASQLSIWMDGHPKSDPLPPKLRELPIGTHHDVSIELGIFHVLKTRVSDYPTYVAIEISSFSSREQWLQAALVSVALLDVPLAFIMGIWLVRRISLPHERLAQRVSDLDPSKEMSHIGKDFAGLEVEQIAAAIDSYQDRLAGFINRERSFTASASHELRTPLATMLTSAEVLHHDPRLPEELQTYTGNLARNAVQMGQLLDGLLWLSRENQRLDYHPVNLESAVAASCNQFSGKTFRIEDSRTNGSNTSTFMLPENLFNIVISNLLRNAWQFSPPDSEIRIVLDPPRILIHNRGPHIPADKLKKIFRMNYRSEFSPGQGLGLYIASNICQRLGWTLQVSSDESSGTEVILELNEIRNHDIASSHHG